MKDSKLEIHVQRLKAGDKSAFDYIYDRTNRPVYFAALYIVRDKMYAEDILHDTYLRAMGNLEKYTPGTNFTAWLCRIGRSLALNHVKRIKRETSTDFEAESYRYGVREESIPFIFDVAMKILSQEEYEILMLCQVAGYKRREVAEMLALPIGTVTWRNNEALKKLKNYLEKEGAQ